MDNEIDGVSSDAFGNTLQVTELGSTTYEVVLDTDPLDEEVVVTISSDDPTAVQVQKSPDAAAEMVTLTFTTSDWNTAQTVTVTAVDDTDDVGEQVTLSHAVSGYGVVIDAGTVTIVVLDDEVPTGIELSLTPPSVTEGDTMAVTVTAAFVPSGTSQAAPITVPVRVGMTPGTATAGTDFTAISEIIMVTIPMNTTSATGEFMFEALEDTIVDPDETVLVDVESPVGGFTVAGTTLTITDNDIPPTVIELSVNSGSAEDPASSVTEGSGTTTVLVTAAFPTGSPTLLADTVVTVSVAGGGDNPATDEGTDFATVADFPVIIAAGTISGSATFDLVVTGDTLAEGNETLTVSATAADSFDSITAVTLTITDDDTPDTDPPGVTITPTTLTVAEEGAVGTYMVVLDTRPDSDVTVTVVPDLSTTAPVTVAPASGTLTFTPETWDTDQTFTVTATEDDDAIGGTRILGHTVAGYTGLVDANVGSVEVTVTDDDIAIFGFDSVIVNVPEDTGDATVTMTLDRAIPTGFEVTISTTGYAHLFFLFDATAGSDYTETTTTLTFAGTANERQTLTVPILDDDVAERTETFGFGAFDAAQNLMVVPSDPEVSLETLLTFVSFADRSFATIGIINDDPSGITLSVAPDRVTEGSDPTEITVTAAFFPVGTKLAADATVSVTVAGDSATADTDFTAVSAPIPIIIAAGSTSFTDVFTLTVMDDTDEELAETLTFTAPNVDGLSVIGTTLTIPANDTAGVTITPTTLAVTEGAEGAEGSYTVVLDSDPAGPVEVTIAADSSTAPPITVSSASLSFNSTNWHLAQTVTVTAVEDADTDGGTRTLAHTVSGYGTVTSADPVMVTVTDNNMAGVTLSATTLEVTEGAEGSYTVVLASEPAGTVEVTIAADSDTAPPITFSPLSLSFNSTTWSTAQTVTVTATEDDDAIGGTRTLTHTVTGYGDVATAVSVTVEVNDNDTAGVTITPTTPLTVAEGGEETYTVVLDSMPDSTVMVTIVEDAGTTAPLTIDPSSLVLSFSPALWNIAQTVTVTAAQDDDAIDGTRVLAHTVSGYTGVATAASVTVEVTDDDTPGVSITPTTTLTVIEGGVPETYMVVLDNEPAVSATVAITMGTSLTAPITVSPISLTFGSTNWRDPQTVTVTATEDADALGGMRTLMHTVTGYGDVATAASVAVTVTDNDRATVAFVDLVTDRALPTGTDPLPSDTPVATVMEATPSVDATFRVVLNARDDLDTIVIMGYTADFTATDEEDYTLNWPGPDSDQFVITVPAGDLVATETFTMSVVSDEIVEGNEAIQFPRLFVNGVAPTSPQPEFLKIVDDDVATVSLDSPTVSERAGFVTVRATLDKAVARGVSIPFSTADGSGPNAAVAGTDYTAFVDGEVFFAGRVGEVFPIAVAIISVSGTDGDKTFSISLGTPVPSAARDDRFTSVDDYPVINTGASSTVTISDADAAPTGIVLSLSPSSVTEGTSEFVLVTAAFVPPDADQTDVITVPVRVRAGTATAGTDFTAISDTIMVTIPARATVSTIPGEFMLTTLEDTIFDPDETVFVDVDGMVGRFTVAGTTLTITDNDIPPMVIELSVNSGDAVDPASVAEDRGTTTVMVTAAFPPGSPTLTTQTDVEVTVAGGTADAGSSTDTRRDFTEVLVPFTVTIPAGETSSTTPGSFSLAVNDDGDDELDETVTVSGMALGTTTITAITPATLTITDNDDPPTVERVDLTASVMEGDASAVATFTVHLNTRGHLPTTVTMEDDRSGAATEGTDYTLDTTDWPFGTNEFLITVAADALSRTGTFRLSVAEDEIVEGNEEIRFQRIKVNGVAPTGEVSPEFLKILDDDEATVSLDSPPVAENAGPVTVTATVDKMVEGGFTIPVSTMVGTADATDFTAVTGMTLMFDGNMEGETQTFTVPILDDGDVEGDEMFSVSLGVASASRSNLPVGDINLPVINAGDSITVTITNDDTAGVTITPTTLAVTEGGEQTYTVKLDTTPAGAVTVAVTLGSGATAPITVTPLSLSFSPTTWSTAQTVTVTATEDADAVGGTRTLEHTVTGYGDVATAASVTVEVNDDDTAGVTITPTTPLTVAEGGEETYTVVLDSMPDSTVMVTIVEDAGTTAPLTIDPSSLVLSFSPALWNIAQTVTVTAAQDDDAIDGTRVLAHTVSGYTGVATAASVTVEVTDDDTPGVSITPTTTLTVIEGGVPETYMVVLDSEPAVSATVAINHGHQHDGTDHG